METNRRQMVRRSKTIFTEAVLRLLIALVMLVNALSPSVAASARLAAGDDKSSSSTDGGMQTFPNIGQPVPNNIKYQPPKKINRPTRFDATPDQTNSLVPPKNPIEFILSSNSSILDSVGQITLNVLIKNNSGQELDNLTFTDPLEPGVRYVPEDNPSLPFDSAKQEINLSITKMLPGQQLVFSYVIQVQASKYNDVHGRLWLHVVQLDSTQSNVHLKAHMPFGSGLPVGNNKSAIAAFNPDGGWNQLGRFSIYMDQNAIDPNSTLMSSPTTISKNGPASAIQAGCGEIQQSTE